MHALRSVLAFVALCIFAGVAAADSITITGAITQSTADGTGPAVNNPSLNAILDGDAYKIDINFAGSITAPGTFALTGVSMLFSDSAAGATEASFNSVSITVSPNGIFDNLSLLGCLSTGTACNQGNFLAMNFMIPATGLNLQNVPAQGIPGLFPPLDLLEDDGITDIQGSVATYSYTGAGSTPVPEPSAIVLLCSGLAVLAAMYFRR